MKDIKTANENKKQKRQGKVAAFCGRFSVVIQFLVCCGICFLIEAMSRHSFLKAWAFVDQRTKVFFYNSFLIFVTTLVAYFFKKRNFFRTVIGGAWLVFGAINGVTLANRVTPLTGPDLGMMKELQGVADKYFQTWQVVLILIAVVAGIALLVVYFLKSGKIDHKRNFKVIVPGFLLACAALAGLTKLNLDTKQLSSYFGNIAYAYQDYGFPYSFCVTVFDTGISQPNHYSQKQVDEIIADEGKIKKTTVTAENAPNIIIVQLESFFDPTEVKWLKFSQDPLPNWHRLQKKYSSGLYTVPVVGAGTVNTEFETLTGMSLRFFGAGEYPYKGVLREETAESAATVLTKLGYTAHAIHDNTATFYGRHYVYANLGFNSFTSSEYMSTQDDVNENGWMRDRNLIGPVNDALNSTKNRDFVYTVSVQPHGAYPTEPVLGNPQITVSGGKNEGVNNAWTYYANQIYEEDQFVRSLIDDLSKRKEPTVLMLYGDHLPTMGLSESDLTTHSLFDTNYLIWDNIGLKKQNQTLTSYQAVANLFNRIGIHEGVMFNFQQKMAKNPDYLYDMQVLQYDMLYGKKYVFGQTNPYSPTLLAMGVKPVSITSIHQLGKDDDGVYEVYGKNLTQSCALKVNDTIYDATFINSGKLLVGGVKLKEGDWVSLAVRANSSSHPTLSTSNTLVYGVGRLADAAD